MNLSIHDQPLPYVDLLPERPAETVELVVIHCTELPDLAMAREYGVGAFGAGGSRKQLAHARGTLAAEHRFVDRFEGTQNFWPG